METTPHSTGVTQSFRTSTLCHGDPHGSRHSQRLTSVLIRFGISLVEGGVFSSHDLPCATVRPSGIHANRQTMTRGGQRARWSHDAPRPEAKGGPGPPHKRKLRHCCRRLVARLRETVSRERPAMDRSRWGRGPSRPIAARISRSLSQVRGLVGRRDVEDLNSGLSEGLQTLNASRLRRS